MTAPFKQTHTKDQALQKCRHFCGYQERCHQEVKEKLYSLGMRSQDIEEIMSQLIEENYLNEERFATAYAGGKFRMNQWGKVKIKHALKQKQVSDYCIMKAMKEIDESDYRRTVIKLAESKRLTLKGEKSMSARKKIFSFLLQKGYESELINEVINNLD